MMISSSKHRLGYFLLQKLIGMKQKTIFLKI